jgi:hypothetical protein
MAVVPQLCFVDFFIYPKGYEGFQETYADAVLYVVSLGIQYFDNDPI